MITSKAALLAVFALLIAPSFTFCESFESELQSELDTLITSAAQLKSKEQDFRKSQGNLSEEETAILSEVQELRRRVEEREIKLRSTLKAVQDGPDKTKGVSSICPVHRIQMTVESVPIHYGLRVYYIEEQKNFLFARRFVEGGCNVGQYSATRGKIYVCSKCVEADERWKKTAAGK